MWRRFRLWPCGKHGRRKVVTFLCIILIVFVYSLTFSREANRGSLFTEERQIIDLNAEMAKINTSEEIATVDEKFLSVGMSWKTILSWSFNATTEQRMISLTKAFSPAYVRIGGIASNFVNFQLNEDEKSSPFGKLTVHITGKDLDRVHRIAKNAGWQVLFALSAFRRSMNGSWDPSNSFRIVKYAADKGYKFGWELGNGKEI